MSKLAALSSHLLVRMPFAEVGGLLFMSIGEGCSGVHTCRVVTGIWMHA